jgi:hypothetical protein
LVFIVGFVSIVLYDRVFLKNEEWLREHPGRWLRERLGRLLSAAKAVRTLAAINRGR